MADYICPPCPVFSTFRLVILKVTHCRAWLEAMFSPSETEFIKNFRIFDTNCYILSQTDFSIEDNRFFLPNVQSNWIVYSSSQQVFFKYLISMQDLTCYIPKSPGSEGWAWQLKW